MAENDGGPVPPEDEVVYLDEDGGPEDVASALEAAERAVTAVEERHRTAPHGIRPVSVESAAPAPETQEPAGPGGRVEEEQERALLAEEEAGRLREALLRKAADFENLKRRSERDKSDYVKYALSETMRDLVSVLDNLERALAHAPATGAEDFRAGVEMIARQLSEVLRKYGVSEIPALGTPFDPQFHEAMMRGEAADVPPGTVIEVFQKGYILNDRLLRPAMVKVSAVPAAPFEE
ncbi:MAG: nucleotide exchange factor GrpE [Deltaproteobacteria bacterium]|nr:nucleotide exchange factor GrpE [Deltaproteobacteria bacterium]